MSIKPEASTGQRPAWSGTRPREHCNFCRGFSCEIQDQAYQKIKWMYIKESQCFLPDVCVMEHYQPLQPCESHCKLADHCLYEMKTFNKRLAEHLTGCVTTDQSYALRSRGHYLNMDTIFACVRISRNCRTLRRAPLSSRPCSTFVHASLAAGGHAQPAVPSRPIFAPTLPLDILKPSPHQLQPTPWAISSTESELNYVLLHT